MLTFSEDQQNHVKAETDLCTAKLQQQASARQVSIVTTACVSTTSLQLCRIGDWAGGSIH